MTERLGPRRAVLAVVLAGALVTYGGVSLFVAFFVLAPMAQALFRAADIPRRLMPAAIALGTTTFTMSALAGHARDPERDPDAVLRHDARSRRPASASSPRPSCWGSACGGSAAPKPRPGARARALAAAPMSIPVRSQTIRSFASARRPRANSIRPRSATATTATAMPPIGAAVLPLAVVVSVNLLMSLVVLPRLDFSFLAEERWGATSLSAVAGVWAVAVALAAASLTLVVLNYRRLPSLRESMDAGANASVLPAFSVASLVGFGAVVAALPAFAVVRDWVLSIEGGPLVSLAVATNVLAALTGSASGGMTIALDALGETYMRLAAEQGIDPALMHRVAVIGAGTLDSLPHNGAVVTLLAVCGSTHRESYLDIAMVAIVGAIIALAAVIALGSVFGSF